MGANLLNENLFDLHKNELLIQKEEDFVWMANSLFTALSSLLFFSCL